MRIGIFGGSFNPVHRGHLESAVFAFSELNLDHLYFVPTFQTPLKSGKALLSCQARLKLLQKALRPYPHFSVSDCEIQRQGKSYTVDTLKHFHSKVAKDDQLYFLAGADVLANIRQWKSIESIFKFCRFVVTTRPGHGYKDTDYPVIWMPFEALRVSSTEIRNRLKRKENVNDLVPAAIAADLEKCFQLCHPERSPAKSRDLARKLDSSARLRLGRNDKRKDRSK